MQNPSIGRVVYYNDGEGIKAAIVCHVHEDGTTVNLASFDSFGNIRPRTSVIAFDGPQDEIPPTQWGWMDFQRNYDKVSREETAKVSADSSPAKTNPMATLNSSPEASA
jgi:hypothetical protein